MRVQQRPQQRRMLFEHQQQRLFYYLQNNKYWQIEKKQKQQNKNLNENNLRHASGPSTTVYPSRGRASTSGAPNSIYFYL